MKYTIVNVQKLLAALKPSQFRPFKEAILKQEFKKYLNHIFKGEDRIYLPFEASIEIEVPKKIEDYLSSQQLEIVDYKSGLAKNKDGKLAKIGKALNKNEDGKKLLDLFNTSRSGVKKKDELLIVISRHPYDIAGMSTGRGRDEPGDSKEGWGWSSCMNLRSGLNRFYVTKDIENGTLIAYIIDSNDKNINKPIARMLLKQYINMDNSSDKILYPSNEVHGIDIPGFRKKIIEWLKTFQEMKGTYSINKNIYPLKEEEYIGGDKDEYFKNNPDKMKEFGDVDLREKYYYNHPEDKDAKFDDFVGIRMEYYRLFPEDKDAKFDKSYKIRMNYYDVNNWVDPDAGDDEDNSIKEEYFLHYPDDERAEMNRYRF